MKKYFEVRESNFELLRIVSMLFVILHHLTFYSNYQISHLFNLNDIVFTGFISGGKLGVILFVMTTGYYMINTKEIKLKKLVELELQVLFYSIGFLLLFGIFGNRFATVKEFFKLLFPNISKTYWFFSSYFILYLCIPYLNKLILSLKKIEFFKLLVIGFIFLILVQSVVIYNREISEGLYLFYYYMIGSYIRLYGDNIKGCIRYLLVFCCSYLLVIGITLFIRYLSFSNGILLDYLYSFSKASSILIFSSAIGMFLFFKNLNIGKNWLINLLASVSFGVYLFHEHLFMRELLWENIFSVDKLLSSGSFLILGLISVVLVYIFGGIIEIVRKGLFKYFSYIIENLRVNKHLN